MYYWGDFTTVIVSCLRKVMRNYEKELLEELRNNNYDDDILNEESDEELSHIWNISGHMTVTDFDDPKFKLYRNQSNERDSQKDGNRDTKETLTDNYMRYIDKDRINGTATGDRSVDDSESDHNVDADDEDSDRDTDSDSDSDDDMFDVCIRESLFSRRRRLPYNNGQKSRQYNGSADDDTDVYEDGLRPLVIVPIKRRYAIQESLRIRVLKSEATKAMSHIFKSKCYV